MPCLIWASTRENLAFGFLYKTYPKQSAQLQMLKESYYFASRKLRYDTFQYVNGKGADGLRGCTGHTAPVLFTNHKHRLSRV